MILRAIITISFVVSFFSCNDSSKNKREDKKASYYIEPSTPSFEFVDGQYCAQVKYSNPKTGTVSEYELIVDVEKGKLIIIRWPNGGWLDESHFTPKELNENGAVSFVSDKGYTFDVQLKGERPCEFEIK